jgi:hypothetical protein
LVKARPTLPGKPWFVKPHFNDALEWCDGSGEAEMEQ